ncbi:MAG: hypothetical protein ABIQ01_04785 [Pseudolysinimonas sp.]
MSEIVVLDAVSVATIARAARDAASGLAGESGPADSALSMLPDPVSAVLRRIRSGTRPSADPPLAALTSYAAELDDIAEAVLSLDQREHELEHQLRWWAERIVELQAQLTGEPATDIETGRELALFRGRISGAHAMQRHYAQERAALADRHDLADAACATELAAS